MFNWGKKGLSAGPLRPFKGSNLPVRSNTWLPPTWGAIETETIVGLQADPSCRENSPWRAELAPRGNEPEKEEMARGSYALALPIEAIYMADNRMGPGAADKHPSAAETQAWPAPANAMAWNAVWVPIFPSLFPALAVHDYATFI